MLALKQDRKPMPARTWVFVINLVVHPDAAAMTNDSTKHFRVIFFTLVDNDMHMVEITFPASRTQKSVIVKPERYVTSGYH
jgi:hypothetical protein